MIFVCVDDDNIKLPDFLTAVPTIYLVSSKKIIMDEQIINWIQEQSISNNSINTNELQAYFGETNNSFGSNFCSIDNSERKPFISNYTFLDSTPQNTNTNINNNQLSASDSKLEQLKKAREDFAPIQRR